MQKCHRFWQWKELVKTAVSEVEKWEVGPLQSIPIILQKRPSSPSAMLLGTAVSVYLCSSTMFT